LTDFRLLEVPLARIPDEVIERVRAEVPLLEVVRAGGVGLKRVGRDWHGCCPFHEDSTPSLVVSPGKGLWHCLGACAAGGSVIDWVMRARGVSFRHAVELLRDGLPAAAVAVVGPVGSAKRSTTRVLAAPVDRDAGDAELLGQVVDFYARTLTESPEALAWLRRRRIDHPEALAEFRLGYANRTLGLRLPDKRTVAGAELRGRLETLGVFRASGHEHLNGSVVVPLFDGHGAVVDLYGRKVRDDLRAGTPAHLYLPGPHRGVFNAAALAGCGGEVILTESLLDALTFWSAGYRNVTASFGTNGFTPAHLQAFVGAGIGRVLIAYDNDPAGNTAADKLGETLLGNGFECLRVVFPPGADANDLAVAAADPGAELGRVLRSARWLGRGTTHTTTGTASVGEPLVGPRDPVAGMLAGPVADAPGDASVAIPVEVPGCPGLSGTVREQPPVDGVPVVADGELRLVVGDRRWRVRGLATGAGADALRCNVMITGPGPGGQSRFHVDTLDLYSARARAVFIAAAAVELGLQAEVVKRDLGRVLLAAEDTAAHLTAAANAPVETVLPMSEPERAAALGLLRDPDLIGRISVDLGAVGIVGEADNALLAYLASVSRKLSRPLAVIVQSTSAAGKSTLVDAVLATVPAEDLVRFSAMTGQSLFYLGESDLAHKVLSIAEEEGATRAAYALKLLQSDGKLSIASTGKDNASGRLVTHTYSVNGPAAIFLTTTSIEVDPELLNRALVLTVDEDRSQTRAIHAAQRAAATLDGLLASAARDQVLLLHQNAQRLLEPLAVVNPHAPGLSFTDTATRARRDHMKYLTLISAVALLHQHQREIQTATVPGPTGRTLRYIEATPADVAIADRLATRVLARSLDDLPPGTRRLLEDLVIWVQDTATRQGCEPDLVRFTRRRLREALAVGDTQAKVHLARLVDLELVLAHRSDGGGWTYELAWQPPTSTTTTGDRSGPAPARSGPGRGEVGSVSAPGRGTHRGLFPLPGKGKTTPGPADDTTSADPHLTEDISGPVVVAPVAAAAGGGR
jgi:DNA primase catalytic core